MLDRLPLTGRGTLALLVGLGLCAAAFPLHQAALLWPGLFLVALPLVSWLSLLLTRPRLAAARAARPTEPAVGVPFNLDVRLWQRGTSLRWAVRVIDVLPAALGGSHGFTITAPPHGRQIIETRLIVPTRRGRYDLATILYGVTDALGLARRSTTGSAPVTIIVTPRVLPLAGMSAAASGRTGETPVPHLALDGPDDVLVREYRPRDDVRRIHWPSTARTGNLMVRREERAWDPAAQIILDSRSTAYPSDATGNAFEWAVTLAASVGVGLLEAGYLVSITGPDASRIVTPSRTTSGQRGDLLRSLAEVSLSGSGSLISGVRSLGSGNSAHLVVAILGRLTLDDARGLLSLSDGQQRCWALCVDSAGREAAAADQLLRAHGWRLAAAPPDSDARAAWAALGTPRRAS